MRTIAEEDGVAAEPMRDAALKDGALLRHLVSSSYRLEMRLFFRFLKILSICVHQVSTSRCHLGVHSVSVIDCPSLTQLLTTSSHS
jgi:hypothetical protein